jgi:hypothetical protein
MSDRSRTSLID